MPRKQAHGESSHLFFWMHAGSIEHLDLIFEGSIKK